MAIYVVKWRFVAFSFFFAEQRREALKFNKKSKNCTKVSREEDPNLSKP